MRQNGCLVCASPAMISTTTKAYSRRELPIRTAGPRNKSTIDNPPRSTYLLPSRCPVSPESKGKLRPLPLAPLQRTLSIRVHAAYRLVST